MAILALKAWYLAQYEPIRDVIKRPPDLRLNRNSLLKSALRADFLDDVATIQSAPWFERYLEGDAVEFYIEGSGNYVISNLDLISQEIYFTKQDAIATFDSLILLSTQNDDPLASEALRTVLQTAIDGFNQRSRIPIELEETQRPKDFPLRLSDSQLRKLRKSLLVIVDITAISEFKQKAQTILLPNPTVCVELGYALQCKKAGQILLVNRERPEFDGKFPFDVANHRQLSFTDETELSQTLPNLVEAVLQRFNLVP